tara:strand:- start:15 stop:281 length:267 start_codon:yes stop_codon:yes gene_type:complete
LSPAIAEEQQIIEPNKIEDTIPTSDKNPRYFIKRADSNIVAIVNPETGLFEEPTIPDMYPAIDEKMKAIIIMSNVINNDVGTSRSIWL